MSDPFSSLESVQGHHRRALAHVIEAITDHMNAELSEIDASTKSPIEAIFAIWWEAFRTEGFFRVRELNLMPQFKIDPIDGRNYTLDFSITPHDVEYWREGIALGCSFNKIAIEMDGHEFHERTKEQVTWRNQRDRDLQRARWRILHFSGTELYKDPERVVTEAIVAGTEALNIFSREVRARKRERGDYNDY